MLLAVGIYRIRASVAVIFSASYLLFSNMSPICHFIVRRAPTIKGLTNARYLMTIRRIPRMTKPGFDGPQCEVLTRNKGLQSHLVHAFSVTSDPSSNSYGSLFLLLTGAALSLSLTTVTSCEKGGRTQENIAWARLEQSYNPYDDVSRTYVHRKETEHAIIKHIHSEPNRVMVLFGNRHIGKTTVLKNVLAQEVSAKTARKGVIVVHIDSVKNIDQAVARAFGVHPDTLRDSRAFVVKMCERFLAEHHYRPVIVFTITGINKIVGSDALVLASMLREFSVETRAAVCIADLHDLDTAQSFPRDGRTLFMTVPELSKSEIEQYLGKERVTELGQRSVSLEQIETNLGGNPRTLSDLCLSDDPAVFLREAVQQAAVELQELMEKCPTHGQAILTLSKAPYETGLPLKAYSDAAGSAQTAADIAKVYNSTVYYDFQNKAVKFRSRALHAAAQKKSWF